METCSLLYCIFVYLHDTMKNFKNIALFSFLILMLGWSSDLKAQPAKGIDFFHGSFQEAQVKAKKEGKVIFMDAYTVWCGPCRHMAATAFKNEKVAEFYNSHFINLKVDMEKGEGPQLARKYRVMAYPSLFYIRTDGSVVKRYVGGKNVNQLLTMAREVEGKK